MAKATLTKFQRSLLQRLADGHVIRVYGTWGTGNYYDDQEGKVTSGGLVSLMRERGYVWEEHRKLQITDKGRLALESAGG